MHTVKEAPPELVTTQQLAELLNVGARSVWRWSRSGRIPAPVRIGNAVRFKWREIEEWIRVGCPPVDGGGELTGGKTVETTNE